MGCLGVSPPGGSHLEIALGVVASRLLKADGAKLQFGLPGEGVESGIGDSVDIGFGVEERAPMERHKE